ncbi:MAG: zincin-like metallopeptidase domain-containing protein [Roseburia sp.]|nr:zincin-like metallopeptidase domain-containing protein [Roseburia sp.]
MAKNKMREEMVDAFLNALQEDRIPWHKTWSAAQTMPPRNAAKGTEYRGVNRFWLFYTAEQNGYSDPRWCTFKQAKENGWHVKKGEKGTHIEFWSLYDWENKKTISDKEAGTLRQELSQEEYEERIKPVANNYTVFNAEQLEGIPKLSEPELQIYELDEGGLIHARTVLVENMEVHFQEGGEKAFYRPSEDCIHLPEIERFESEYAYMSTLLHEAGHATGHESRLNRPKGNKFGSPEYAKEELRAEIASAFTAQTLHIPQSESHMENHKAYVQSWIRILKDEPDELFRAIKEAEKISDYLIEKGEFFPEKQQKAELDMQKQQYVTDHRKELEKIPLEKTPVVINAFGGPGSGKSTACMDICQQLKKLGYNAEYVQEYAKELVYDKNWELLDGSEAHQFEILKEQMHRMDRLYGQTDFIVTDSPVLLNTIYNQELTAEYSEMIQELHSQYHNFSFFVERDSSSFQQEGRIQNLEESILKDKEIQELLKNNDIYYGTYTHETIGKVVQNAVTTYDRLNSERDGEKKESVLENSADKISKEVKPEIEEKFMAVAENLAGKLWDEKYGIYTREGEATHLIDSRAELHKAGKWNTLYVREADFAECMKKDFFPTVTCEWSEDHAFSGGKTYLISEFNKKMVETSPRPYNVYHYQYKVNLSADGDSITNKGVVGIWNSITSALMRSDGRNKDVLDQLKEMTAWEKEFMDYQEKRNGVFEQELKAEMEEKYMVVSENLAGKLWDEECSIYIGQGEDAHVIDSRAELYRAGREETFYVRKADFAECMKKEFFPTVTCEWSEHDCFDDGKTYMVSEFNEKMEKSDEEWCKNNRGGEDDIGYAKVKFQVNLSAEGEMISERQDIGDGDGSMIEFLKETGGVRYQKAAEQLEEACTLEKEFLNYQEKLNGIFAQEEGYLPHPEHAMGNCHDEVLNTIQKQINRERNRQGASKPVKRHWERMK